MNIRTPITALAIALGISCAPAFAAGPSSRTVAPTTGAIANAVTQNPDESLVTIVRKVYFFNQLDRDHNGQLSRAEIPKDMVKLRLDFVRADFDGNGQLSPEEYILYSRGLAPQYTGVYHAYTYMYFTGKNNIERIDMTK